MILLYMFFFGEKAYVKLFCSGWTNKHSSLHRLPPFFMHVKIMKLKTSKKQEACTQKHKEMCFLIILSAYHEVEKSTNAYTCKFLERPETRDYEFEVKVIQC